jgi:hypothetical protein
VFCASSFFLNVCFFKWVLLFCFGGLVSTDRNRHEMFREKFRPVYSLFAENGVIVRNLNYRPWQWVYSISGCQSFPGGF